MTPFFRRWITQSATPRLLVEVACIFVAFYAVDRFLASLQARELDVEGRRDFDRGEMLLKQGQALAAAEQFLRAHALDRDNNTYIYALAQAYLAAGQPDRAVSAAEEVLDEDSNDGHANLLTARAMRQKGRWNDTDSFYHRAIYGTWPASQPDAPINARLELVHALAGRGSSQELLSELLLLDQSAHNNPAVANQLPALYIQAHAADRAEAAYRFWIHTNPRDIAAYAGLGRLELEEGNFHSALDVFERSRRFDPGNPDIARFESVARRAFNLDPTSRQLGTAEKLSRSEGILALAEDAVRACAASNPGWSPDSTLRTQADTLLSATPHPPTNQAAETRLDMAARLARSLPPDCASAENNELLSVLIRKIDR